MEYEYLLSHEREMLQKIRNSILELEVSLNRKCAPNYCMVGFKELSMWTLEMERNFKIAFKRGELGNAPIRSSDTQTPTDK